MTFLERVRGFFSSVFGSSNRSSRQETRQYSFFVHEHRPYQVRSEVFHDRFSRSKKRSFRQASTTTSPRTGSRLSESDHNSGKGQTYTTANLTPFIASTTLTSGIISPSKPSSTAFPSHEQYATDLCFSRSEEHCFGQACTTTVTITENEPTRPKYNNGEERHSTTANLTPFTSTTTLTSTGIISSSILSGTASSSHKQQYTSDLCFSWSEKRFFRQTFTNTATRAESQSTRSERNEERQSNTAANLPLFTSTSTTTGTIPPSKPSSTTSPSHKEQCTSHSDLCFSRSAERSLTLGQSLTTTVTKTEKQSTRSKFNSGQRQTRTVDIPPPFTSTTTLTSTGMISPSKPSSTACVSNNEEYTSDLCFSRPAEHALAQSLTTTVTRIENQSTRSNRKSGKQQNTIANLLPTSTTALTPTGVISPSKPSRFVTAPSSHKHSTSDLCLSQSAEPSLRQLPTTTLTGTESKSTKSKLYTQARQSHTEPNLLSFTSTKTLTSTGIISPSKPSSTAPSSDKKRCTSDLSSLTIYKDCDKKNATCEELSFTPYSISKAKYLKPNGQNCEVTKFVTKMTGYSSNCNSCSKIYFNPNQSSSYCTNCTKPMPPAVRPSIPSTFSTPHSLSTPTYSLRDFTFKMRDLPKDKSFKPQNNIVYQNQWTTCHAIITDNIGNRVNRHDDVEITSLNSRVEFRNTEIHNGRLQFSMKASDAETNTTVCITIKGHSGSDCFTFTKDIQVCGNPCSNTLSEIAIKEIVDCKNGNCKCIYRLKLVDVFGDSVVREEDCNFEVLEHEDGVEIEKQKCFSDGHLCFDISIKGKRPWSKEVAVFLNGKKIPLPEKYEVTNDERDKLLSRHLDSLDDNHYKPIQDFLVWENSRAFIPLSPCLDDGKLVPYDDKMCKIEDRDGDYQLVCQNTTKKEIMGPDFAHINNISRVLRLTRRLQLQETPDQTSILLKQGNIPENLHRTCKLIVLHLLRGSYYRKKASETARVRMEWKERANSLGRVLDLFSHEYSTALAVCKYFKDFFRNLINEYNRKACEELFSFFNFNRVQSEVDLHGLHVADEEKLLSLKLELLSENLNYDQLEEIIAMSRMEGNGKGHVLTAKMKNRVNSLQPDKEIHEILESSQKRGNEWQLKVLKQELEQKCNRKEKIDDIITRCRSEGDEAIRKLQEILECFDREEAVKSKQPWIEIIVGAGRHSRKKGKQNIRPKVEKFLNEKGHTFTAVNKGSLVVTFVEYNGPEPCFGEYYCENCDRCWKSSKSYIGKYQQCSRCRKKCWPVKQRTKEKVLNYYRDGKKIRKSKPHPADLCQKCKELGHLCNENY